MPHYTVLAFTTTHDALAAEAVLKAADVANRTVPTPQSLGRLCGISLRVPIGAVPDAEAALAAAGIRVSERVDIEDV